MTIVDDLRRLTEQSRVRLAALEGLREECCLIARQSRRRLEEGQGLLERARTTREV